MTSRTSSIGRRALFVGALLAAWQAFAATAPADDPEAPPDLVDFATRYAAAWSGQDPQMLAGFYAEDGSLVVNDGEPAVGREAVAEKAATFKASFPDMVVRLVEVTGDWGGAEFHWHWTGTNTGPGGTGRSVDLTGYEEWNFTADGLISESRGHYDEAEYRRQMSDDAIFQ